MKSLSHGLARDYLAIGLDPQRVQVTLFKQSAVSAHTELAWIFDTITTMPYLMRAHAFKDAEAKDKEISVGTFNYPMLMAADILLYGPDIVPVGQDQKQHIEYARDTAEKFNRIFGDTFKLPEAYIQKEAAIVPGVDGRKMSKSYGNTIPLFSSREEITKAVMSIVTDSSGGRPENVYALHALFKPAAELDALYDENQGKYKVLKEVYNICISAINIMRPLNCMEIYTRFNAKRVLNFCAGWGGSTVAAAALNLEAFYGVEINTDLKESYDKMVTYLRTKSNTEFRIQFCDAVDVDYSTIYYDTVFASPPYYFIEKYANNNGYKSKADMDSKFYRPVFTKTYNGLKKGGNFIINVCKEVYDNVLKNLFGEAHFVFPLKKSKRQNNHTEMVYVWIK